MLTPLRSVCFNYLRPVSQIRILVLDMRRRGPHQLACAVHLLCGGGSGLLRELSPVALPRGLRRWSSSGRAVASRGSRLGYRACLSSVVAGGMLLAGCVVCPTGLQPEAKQAVQDQVESMGGTFQVDLNQHITHLVADSVGSAKYNVSPARGEIPSPFRPPTHGRSAASQIPCRFQAAVHYKMNVVTPDWVAACHQQYTAGQPGPPPAAADFWLPPLRGKSISVTGFDPSERNIIKEQTELLGGKYSPSLTVSETTHLIACLPTGAKFDAARAHNIPIVSLEWFREINKSKYYVPEADYPAGGGGPSAPPGSTRPGSGLGGEEVPTNVFPAHILRMIIVPAWTRAPPRLVIGTSSALAAL